jgi:hypothetical protein
MYGAVEVYLHSFLSSALDGHEGQLHFLSILASEKQPPMLIETLWLTVIIFAVGNIYPWNFAS